MASSFPAHQICILSCLLPGNRIEERIDCKQRPFHVKWSFYFSALKLETVDIKVYALDERLKYRCNKTSRKRKVHMDVHFVCLLKTASIYVVLPDDDSCRDNASGGSCRAVAHFPSVRLAGQLGLGWPAHSRKHCSYAQCFRQNSIFSSQQSAGTVFWLIFQSCRTAPSSQCSWYVPLGDRNLLRSTCSCKKIQSPVKISFSG